MQRAQILTNESYSFLLFSGEGLRPSFGEEGQNLDSTNKSPDKLLLVDEGVLLCFIASRALVSYSLFLRPFLRVNRLRQAI